MLKKIKKSDLPYEIDDEQIRKLIKIANLNSRDTFYDLGSARGRVIIVVANETNVKKAIGIESERELYQYSRQAAEEELTTDKIKKVDYWYGDFDAQGFDGKQFLYDLCDATVVYLGVDEEEDTIGNLKERFKKRTLKIITKNLPFVGYDSIANRDDEECWFYLTTYPPTRIRGKREWAGSVFEKKDASINEVFNYYSEQLKRQYPGESNRKYRNGTLLSLKKLVNERF